MSSSALAAIRRDLQANVGRTVELVSNSRRRLHSRTGVLEGAYASVFTVVVADEEGAQRLSYTYADILTKAVSIRAVGKRAP